MKTQTLHTIIAALLLASCNYFMPEEQHEKIIAAVDEKQLKLSDIAEIFPEGISSKDSIQLLKNYVNNWTRKCVIANNAEKNLINPPRQLMHQVDNFRMSLLTYHYEIQYLQKELDTLVCARELEAYHRQNSDNLSTPPKPMSIQQLKEQYYATIINKRRQQLINKLENDAYNEAVDNKRIKTYIDE